MKGFSVICDYRNATVDIMLKRIIIYMSYCRSGRHWLRWKTLYDSSFDRIHWSCGKVQLTSFVDHRFSIADMVDIGQRAVVSLEVFRAIRYSTCRSNSFVIVVGQNVTNFLVVST